MWTDVDEKWMKRKKEEEWSERHFMNKITIGLIGAVSFAQLQSPSLDGSHTPPHCTHALPQFVSISFKILEILRDGFVSLVLPDLFFFKEKHHE